MKIVYIGVFNEASEYKGGSLNWNLNPVKF